MSMFSRSAHDNYLDPPDPAADFEEVAARQGWSEESQLKVVTEFIDRQGLTDELAEFARGVAERENED